MKKILLRLENLHFIYPPICSFYNCSYVIDENSQVGLIFREEHHFVLQVTCVLGYTDFCLFFPPKLLKIPNLF